MVSRENTERLLYWAISFFLNLILFSFLSLYLFVRTQALNVSPPLKVYLQDLPQRAEELKLKPRRDDKAPQAKKGEGIVDRGRQRVYSAPLEVEKRQADVPVPSGRSNEEPSLLSEVEAKVRGRQAQVGEEGLRQGVSESLGNITAVVSSGGVGISGGSRGVVYMPPFPKLVSDEPLGILKLKVWVEPSGVVSRVEVLQRSGSLAVDQKLVDFAKRIRFEPISTNVVQTGVLTFKFKGG